jgi:predicted ATP-dependent serine protease
MRLVQAPHAGEVADARIVTAKQLAASRSRYLKLPSILTDALGELPEVFALGLYGPPGAGKSSLALTLASALIAAADAPALYASIEEGLGSSMAVKLRQLEVRDERLHIGCAYSPGQIVAAAREVSAGAVVIDSLSNSWMTPEDCARIQREAGVSVIVILHVTKAGTPRGSSSILHWCDVLCRVEDGRVYREKSRFSGVGEGALPWAILSGQK